MTGTQLLEAVSYVAVIGASIVAVYGINTWGREHVGKRRMELAEDTLASFYEAKDAIAAIRSRFGHASEGTSRKPGPNEPPMYKEKLDSAYVTMERYQRHSAMFSKLFSTRYRFQALIGLKESKPFDDLNRVINELHSASYEMMDLSMQPEWATRSDEREKQLQWEFIRIRRVLYGSGEDSDEISARMVRIVDEMNGTCRAIIEGQGSRFPLLLNRLTLTRNKR